VAGEGDRGPTTLALVSVLAAAAVGIAGAATALVVSRDQRATERETLPDAPAHAPAQAGRVLPYRSTLLPEAGHGAVA
jgi:hypothetical protein